MRTLPLWLIFFVLIFLRAAAQENDVYTSYGVDDGLPQSSVWSIVRDKQGFLWVCTSDGVCRFDGYKFTGYNVTADNSIEGGNFNRLYCDNEKGLWATSRNGISRYDNLTDKFTLLFNHLIGFNYSTCFIGEDNRYVFAGMGGYGIIKIDKGTNKVQTITNETTAHITSWVNAVLCGDEIWVTGTRFGSYVYNLKSGKLDSLPQKTLTAIINYNDSQILAGGDNELIFFNKKDHSFKKIPCPVGKNITGILPLSSSEIMLSNTDGIYYVETNKWTILRHTQSFGTTTQNPFTYVQCIYKDGSGNIWIGTNGDGLKKLTAPYKRFKHYVLPNSSGALVKAIYADQQNIYVGYYNTGLAVFNKKSGWIKCRKRNLSAT